jgi:hypothetical protein
MRSWASQDLTVVRIGSRSPGGSGCRDGRGRRCRPWSCPEPARGDRRGGERRDPGEPRHRVHDPKRRDARGPGDQRARGHGRQDGPGQHRRDDPLGVPAACPDPERLAQLLGELVPDLDPAQRRRLAEETDLRLLRISSSGLPVAPLEISTAATADALALSVGYPHGGIPRFVWPASLVPLPAIGIGQLVVAGGDAAMWTSWRVHGGDSGGPVLVREHGRLRVGTVTYLQHGARRSRGNATHIPAPVLRAYVAAVKGAGGEDVGVEGAGASSLLRSRKRRSSVPVRWPRRDRCEWHSIAGDRIPATRGANVGRSPGAPSQTRDTASYHVICGSVRSDPAGGPAGASTGGSPCWGRFAAALGVAVKIND